MASAAARAGADAEDIEQPSAAAAAALGASAPLLSAAPLECLQLLSVQHPSENATATGFSCKQLPAATVKAAVTAAQATAAAAVQRDGQKQSRVQPGECSISTEPTRRSPPETTEAAAAAAAATAVPTTVPLEGLKLSSQESLRLATRQKCPSCGKPRAFFCYDCLVPLMQGMPQLPSLPVTVHIVMHGETNAQATGTHAAVLAPQCVTLWRHNDGTSHHRRQPASKLQLPDWDPKTTAVLFPASPDTPVVGLWGWLQQQQQQGQDVVAAASTVDSGCLPDEQHLVQLSSSSSDRSETSKCSSSYGSSLFPYEAVVILEGNWAKARTLLKHPKIAPLPCIQLPPHVRSLFWRRGTGRFRAAVDCGVCTIEALYLLCRQLQPEPAGQ